MTASPYASDAKIAATVAAIGATSVANNEQTLLQQILVAVATASGGGGGGGVAWGAITGTLSAQTDLQAALDLKANLTTNTFSGTQTFPIWTDGTNFLFKWSTDRVLLRNAADNAGALLQTGILAADGAIFGASLTVQTGINLAGGNVTILNPANGINWNNDTFLLRGGAANVLELGLDHATTPTAQTLKAHDVTTGIGADLILSGGTGSVADGEVSFGVYTAGVIVPDGWVRIKSKSGLFLRIPVYLEP